MAQILLDFSGAHWQSKAGDVARQILSSRAAQVAATYARIMRIVPYRVDFLRAADVAVVGLRI